MRTLLPTFSNSLHVVVPEGISVKISSRIPERTPHTVCLSRPSMKASRYSKLDFKSDLSRDFAAVMGSLSGAGYARYGKERVLWAARNTYLMSISIVFPMRHSVANLL